MTVTDEQAQTPMSDHVAVFWQLLETEHVRILIDIRRSHEPGSGVMYHWDSASFSDDVAKALVAERAALASQSPTSSDFERDACDEIGCEYDNEALLQAIVELKIQLQAALAASQPAAPVGICDCGFPADICAGNPCYRKKVHLAGLTPGSKWPEGATIADTPVVVVGADRAAVIEECAKVADNFASFEETAIERANADPSLSESGIKDITHSAGSRQVAAEQIAHDIRALDTGKVGEGS
jgi:hypothetical protein